MFAAGMFVTWTVPEGNVSRNVVQSRRDSESPQLANPTHTKASTIQLRFHDQRLWSAASIRRRNAATSS